MFGKLRKKIFYSVFLVAVVLVLSISVVSYILIVGNVYEMQKERADSCVESGASGAKTYITAIMGFVENTAKNTSIITACKYGYGSPTSLLDDLCNNSVVIDGAVLYGLNGYIRYSAGIGAPPTLDELKSVDSVSEFLLSNKDKLVSVRKKVTAKAYHSAYYSEDNGIISCMAKVVDENGTLVGLLVGDITPMTLIKEKLYYSAFDATSNVKIIKGNDVLSTGIQLSDYTKKSGDTIIDEAYISYTDFFDGSQIAMRFSIFSFKKQILIIFFILFGIDFLLILLAFIWAYKFAKSVETPLNVLQNKMREGVANN